MSTEIKFCGLTRPEDVRHAVALGASYVGVIFAGGPRMLTTPRALDVLARVPASATGVAPVKRVGVFADQSPTEIAEMARALALDVVQLHGAADVARVDAVRQVFRGAIWAVARVQGARLPTSAALLVDAADGLVLDAHVPGALGGTGVTLPWSELAHQLDPIRGSRTLVLAGGLRPDNVAQGIAALAPDVVDVSSGVESAPGIKDHERMRAFRDAVMHASIPT